MGSLYNATPVPTFADQLAERTHSLRQEMQAAANANAANYYERTDLLLNLDPKTVTNLKDLVSRNDILFVTGQRSFEEWDDYVAEWRRGGGDALLAEAGEPVPRPRHDRLSALKQGRPLASSRRAAQRVAQPSTGRPLGRRAG